MADEIQSDLAAGPAPELEIPTTPESAEIKQPENEEVEKVSKTFTQEELDAIVGKEKAKERRKAEREYAARNVQVPQPKTAPNEPVSVDQFETYEQYAEALAVQKAEEIVRQRDVQKQRVQIDSTYAERAEKAMEKYDDFEQVAYNQNLRISEVMAEAIKDSDVGPDVAYFLGSNPKEAERIFNLSPLAQAKEIGKIEVKIAAEPPVKKTTSAPAPITPIGARNSSVKNYDTTDPRSTSSMSMSDWIEAENQRELRKLQNKR